MLNQELQIQIELESKVLGCLIAGTYDVYNFARKLCVNSFVEDKNKEIFRTIQRFVETGKQVNLPTIWSEVGRMDKRAGVTTDYILNLPDMQGKGGLETLIDNLEDRRIRREINSINSRLNIKISDTSCTDLGREVAACINDIQRVMEGHSHQYVSIKTASQELVDGFGTPYQGLATGLTFIDKDGGLPLPGFTVIGAGTSQGKSAFAIYLSLKAVADGHRVAYLSLEMSTVDLMQRIMALKSGVPFAAIKRNVIDDIDYLAKINEANEYFKTTIGERFFFEDRNINTMDEIKQSIRALHHTKKIDVVVIDYLQVTSQQQGRNPVNVEQQLAMAARDLHNLAKESGIAIIALSQLNRDRENEEPQLSRLRDSSQIADAADAVILLYRPEKYGKNYLGQFRNCDTHNTALVKVAKMRQGPTGDFLCAFNPDLLLFHELASTKDITSRNYVPENFSGF